MNYIKIILISQDLVDDLRLLRAWQALQEEIDTPNILLVPADPNKEEFYNEALSSLLVFTLTKRGFDYWYDINEQLKQASRALDVAKNIINL